MLDLLWIWFILLLLLLQYYYCYCYIYFYWNYNARKVYKNAKNALMVLMVLFKYNVGAFIKSPNDAYLVYVKKLWHVSNYAKSLQALPR